MPDPSNQISDWLLSSERPPTDLATRLTDLRVKHRMVKGFRYRGTWVLEYSGEVGTEKVSHRTTTTTVLDGEGEEEILTTRGEQRASMVYHPCKGTLEGGFEEVVLVDAVVGASAGWARAAASSVFEGPIHEGAGGSLWESDGCALVADQWRLALHRHVGSIHLDKLDVSDRVTLTETREADFEFIEVQYAFDDVENQVVVGPDGGISGRPPRAGDVSTEGSEAAASLLIWGGIWAVLVVIGLALFVLPGLIAGAVAYVHLSRLSAKREQVREASRAVQRAAVLAWVELQM